MNEIKITTEMCADDRALISRLEKVMLELSIEVRALRDALNTVGTPFPATPTPIPATPTPIPASTDLNDIEAPGVYKVEAEEAPTPEPVKEEPEEAPTPEPAHTKAELQQKVVNLVAAGKKAEVKEIVKQYAPKVSDIPDDKVDEVWALLSKLEG